jgi:hypothetical protein
MGFMRNWLECSSLFVRVWIHISRLESIGMVRWQIAPCGRAVMAAEIKDAVARVVAGLPVGRRANRRTLIVEDNHFVAVNARAC